MARPKKTDKKPQDPTGIDINKLDEELEKDVAKASGLLEEEQDTFVEDDSEMINHSGGNVVDSEPVNHGYEMPPSDNPISVEERDDIPKIDVNYIPEDDGDPLQEDVKRRPYANQGGDAPSSDTLNNDIPKIEPIIPEPISISQPISDINVGREEEVSDNVVKPKQPSEPKRPTINPDLQEMSPSQKRKAAELAADSMLLAYGQFIPIPFKKISSFNIGKLDNSHLKGEIDKNMVVLEDGTTVKSYCESVNTQVDSIFEITQEMKDDIRPPLIDVLLENNIALTPTQRLVMAVGTQLATMGMTAFELMKQNKAAMNQFKVMHKEVKESRASMQVKETIVVKPEVSREPQYQYKTEQPQQQYETVIPEPEIKTEKSKKVEEYIDNSSTGITVETVPNED